MTGFAEVFGELEDPPDVALVVLFVLGIDGIEFAGCAGRREERRVEERSEACQRLRKSGRGDVEVVIRVGHGRVRVRAAVVFGQELGVLVFPGELLCALLEC